MSSAMKVRVCGEVQRVSRGGASGVGGSPASLAGGAGFSCVGNSNQSHNVSAASRREHPSLRATKSRTFPPPLQVPKKFQQFFSSETRNCVRFSPP